MVYDVGGAPTGVACADNEDRHAVSKNKEASANQDAC
jgi:hypothetical protein